MTDQRAGLCGRPRQTTEPMTRTKSLLLVLLAWAVIYLPALGTWELRGEECRRILPAIDMLKTGQWIVPVVAGEYYYSKPPGINWLVAASFAVTGRHDEWAARLPSVLAVLAFVTLLAGTRSPWLDPQGRLVAAVVFLTTAGMCEKGRLIEIEAVYICLTGLAVVWWLNVWSAKGNRWLLWLPPSGLLAFGALVKGPFLAIPFYATVLLVLAYSRRLRELFRPQHFVGIALILAVCLGWAMAASARTPADQMTQGWRSQLLMRVNTSSVDYGKWALNVLKSPVLLAPWLIFLPLVWVPRFTKAVPPEHRAVFRGLRVAMVVSFVLFCAAPGTESRYTMPVLPLACVLIGWVLALHTTPVPSDRIWKGGVVVCAVLLCAVSLALPLVFGASALSLSASAGGVAGAAVILWARRKLTGGARLALATGGVFTMGTLVYLAAIEPFAPAYEHRRPAGMAINRQVPDAEPVYVYRSGHQPFLFYIRQPLRYLVRPDQIGPEVRYILIADRPLAKKPVHDRLSPRRPMELVTVLSPPHRRFHLLELSAPTSNPVAAADPDH